MSKQFTATAVLLLSFYGALALTDPLFKHCVRAGRVGGSSID